MRSWIAILKVRYRASSYASALGVAEGCRQNAQVDLELDDGDKVVVATVIPLGVDDTREEVVEALQRARNLLIKQGHQRAVDVAREVDMIAEVLSNRESDLDHHPPYDYGRFIELVQAIMKGGDTR